MWLLYGIVLLGFVRQYEGSTMVVNLKRKITKTDNIKLTKAINSADINLPKYGKSLDRESMVMINVTRISSNVRLLESKTQRKTKRASKTVDLVRLNFVNESIPLCVLYRIRKSKKSKAEGCDIPPELSKCEQRKVYGVDLFSLKINPNVNHSSVTINYRYYSCSAKEVKKTASGVTNSPQDQKTTESTEKDKITSILLIVIPITVGGILLALFILVLCCCMDRCNNSRKNFNQPSGIHTISSYVTSDASPTPYENMPVDSNEVPLECPLGYDKNNLYATISKSTNGTSGKGRTPEVASPTFTTPPISSMIMQIQEAKAPCPYEQIRLTGKTFSHATHANESEYEFMRDQHPGTGVKGHFQPIRKSASTEVMNSGAPQRGITYASLYFGNKYRAMSLDDVMERGNPTHQKPRGATYCNVRNSELEANARDTEGIYQSPIRQAYYYNVGFHSLENTA